MSFCRFAAKSPMVELSWSRPIFNGTRIIAAGGFAKLYPESRRGMGRPEMQRGKPQPPESDVCGVADREFCAAGGEASAVVSRL